MTLTDEPPAATGTTTAPATASVASDVDQAPGPPPRPVVAWAAVGAAALGLQLYVFGSWILSGDARPISAGGDPVPSAHKAWAIGSQIVLCISAIAIITWVVAKCRRERRLTIEGLLLIGWASIFWGNPLENYTQVMRLASGYMVNLGSWIEHVPGVVSPTADRVPEPLVYMLALYFGYGTLTTFAVAWCLRRMNSRWPSLHGARLFATTWIGLFAVEVLVEALWVQTEIMAYPGGIHSISLFPGETNQVPLHVPFLVSLTLMGFAWLLYSGRARHAVLEAGMDRVQPRHRTRVRVLAMIGFANVVMLAYAVPAQLFAIHAGRYAPDFPSYLNNGVCGDDVGVPCPGPETPVLRDSNLEETGGR